MGGFFIWGSMKVWIIVYLTDVDCMEIVAVYSSEAAAQNKANRLSETGKYRNGPIEVWDFEVTE